MALTPGVLREKNDANHCRVLTRGVHRLVELIHHGDLNIIGKFRLPLGNLDLVALEVVNLMGEGIRLRKGLWAVESYTRSRGIFGRLG